MTALTLCMSMTALAAASDKTSDVRNETAAAIQKTSEAPQPGSIGGEWAVLGLARSDVKVSQDFYDAYYAALVASVQACKGVLSEKKYTDYSRVILALTAIGRDPTNVGGYNLLTALGDFEKTVRQGINGAVWALIALDSGAYAMPSNAGASVQATRDRYIDEILSHQLANGGFSLTAAGASARTADIDISAMALTALSNYQDRADVKAASEKALSYLSAMQDSSGGLIGAGSDNCETVAQVIIALCQMHISIEDSRFVKNGHTLADKLLSFYADGGGFVHVADGAGVNQMATEQAFLALVALQRAENGKTGLYDMADAVKHDTGGAAAYLPGKQADVKALPVVCPGLTFDDIQDHANQTAIEALASRGIINGKGKGLFDPETTMSRAEFAAIVVRALGLVPKENGQFSDVISGTWYAPYVGTAKRYGLVNGSTDTSFNPSGTLTRQEAAAMIARAAKLCGMDTALDTTSVRNILAQFSDYTSVSAWAQESLAFCYEAGILNQDDLTIHPTSEIHRCEIAQMLFNMLGSAKLL